MSDGEKPIMPAALRPPLENFSCQRLQEFIRWDAAPWEPGALLLRAHKL